MHRGVCVLGTRQGRNGGCHNGRWVTFFSKEPASWLLCISRVGPVLQKRMLSRTVRCPCRQGSDIVLLQACARGKEKQRAFLGRGHGTARLLAVVLLFAVLWQLVQPVPEKLYSSFTCKSTQLEGPNRHIWCFSNGIWPC